MILECQHCWCQDMEVVLVFPLFPGANYDAFVVLSCLRCERETEVPHTEITR